jgi:starvation-inducible DNA-binding protein
MASTMTAEKLYKTEIDISQGAREKLVPLLNQQLADTFDLYSQTKQAHWNVKGSDFYQLHLLFDDLAESIQGYIDTIAERATALGGVAMGTARMAASASALDELPLAVEGRAYLDALIDRYAAYAGSTRAAIKRSDNLGDPSTADLFTDISRIVDKDLYFLQSHVQGK